MQKIFLNTLFLAVLPHSLDVDFPLRHPLRTTHSSRRWSCAPLSRSAPISPNPPVCSGVPFVPRLVFLPFTAPLPVVRCLFLPVVARRFDRIRRIFIDLRLQPHNLRHKRPHCRLQPHFDPLLLFLDSCTRLRHFCPQFCIFRHQPFVFRPQPHVFFIYIC